MSELKRLLDDGPRSGLSPLGLELLRSADADGLDERAKTRIAARLGFGGLPTGGGGGGGDAIAPSPVEPAPLAAPAAATSLGSKVGWIALAAIALSAGGYAVSHREPAPEIAHSGAEATPAPPAPLHSVSLEPTIAPAKPAPPEPEPAEVAASPAPAPTAAAKPPSKPSIADEIAALERARSALAASPTRALAELGKYDAKFPAGALRLEAEVLRIQALLAAGRRDEAEALADRLFSNNPSNPYAARVRSLLETNP